MVSEFIMLTEIEASIHMSRLERTGALPFETRLEAAAMVAARSVVERLNRRDLVEVVSAGFEEDIDLGSRVTVRTTIEAYAAIILAHFAYSTLKQHYRPH